MGNFLEHTIGLLRAGPTPDDPASRVGRGRGDAEFRQRLAVKGGQMGRLMNQDDRQLGRNGVEFISGRMPLLLELGVVVTKPENKAVLLRERRGGDPVAHGLLQRRDGIRASIGRRQQIGRDRLQADTVHMPMAVDEARQHGLASQIDLGRAAPGPAHHIRLRSGMDDPALANQHGFDGIRPLTDHGENRPAAVDNVRSTRRAGGAAGGKGQCAGDQGTGQSQASQHGTPFNDFRCSE